MHRVAQQLVPPLTHQRQRQHLHTTQHTDNTQSTYRGEHKPSPRSLLLAQAESRFDVSPTTSVPPFFVLALPLPLPLRRPLEGSLEACVCCCLLTRRRDSSMMVLPMPYTHKTTRHTTASSALGCSSSTLQALLPLPRCLSISLSTYL
jgi:hypothetical protein